MFSGVLEMKNIFYFLLVILSDFSVTFALNKRSLLFPRAGPTRHQLIVGFGMPLELENEAETIGVVMKAVYQIPDNTSEAKLTFFPDIYAYQPPVQAGNIWRPFPNGRRRREVLSDPLTGQKYESYVGDVEEIGEVPLINNTMFKEGGNYGTMGIESEDDEFDDQFEEDIQERKMFENSFLQQQHQVVKKNAKKSDDFDLSSLRWVAYDALSAMLDSKGFNGRICVLRGICEAADVKFSEYLWAELFHIFFTPSTTSERVRKASDYDYIKAETIGRDKTEAECGKVFHRCKRSIIDIFTEVYDNNMFKFQ